MLERLEEDLNIIQSLADRPNEDDSLTAEQLKAKFDEAGNAIKEYINEYLVQALNEDAAHNIGIGVIEGFEECETIADALTQLIESVVGTITGAIPDGSITNRKLKPRAQDGTGGVEGGRMALRTIQGENIAYGAVGTEEIADDSINEDKIADGEVKTSHIANGAVTNDKVASGISGSKLLNGSIPEGKHAEKSIRSTDLKDGCILERHIPEGTIGFEKLKGAEVQAKNKTLTVTLASGRTLWTVAALGVTANNLIFVSPTEADMDEYAECGVKATAQAINSVTFTSKIATSEDITVNIAIFN